MSRIVRQEKREEFYLEQNSIIILLFLINLVNLSEAKSFFILNSLVAFCNSAKRLVLNQLK